MNSMNAGVALVLSGIFVAAPAHSAGPPAGTAPVGGSCVSITAPATISAPGNYCLGNSATVNITSGAAISINANDVVLDCQNNMLKNTALSDTGGSNGIYFNSRNNITIRNCRIMGGFTNGIYGQQDNTIGNRNYYITVEDNYIAGPYFNGIVISGSAIEIRRNKIYDIGGQVNSDANGIALAASSLPNAPHFHIVTDNVIAGTTSINRYAHGVYSSGSIAGEFSRNTIVGTRAVDTTTPHEPNGQIGYNSHGFRLIGTSYTNKITDNQIAGSNTGVNEGITTVVGGNVCFDNFIRAFNGNKTGGCDASLGNY